MAGIKIMVDRSENRNKLNSKYRQMAMLSGLLMLLCTGSVIALFCFLFSWKVIVWAIACILALLLILLLITAFIPLKPEVIMADQVKEVLGDHDRRLLRLALNNETTQEDVSAFLKDWDIEQAPIKSVMLLAYIMKNRPDLEFGALKPRLSGVLSFCRFQNLKREAHFSIVGRAFNDAGIPFIILKGGAMKVYRPDFPRWMNDIDLLVKEDNYVEAVKIAMGLGYDKPMATDHSVDLHLPDSNEGLLDIHEHLELFTDKESELNEGLFKRAEKKKIFSTTGLLPCPEDMIFIALVNLYKNLAKNQTPESSLTTFFDIQFLAKLKPSMDWDIVRDDAIKTGTRFQVLFASNLIASIVPGVFPDSFHERLGLNKKEYESGLVDFLFKKDVLASGRDFISSTSVGEHIKKDWNLQVFIWVNFVSMVKKLFYSTRIKYAVWLLKNRSRKS